MTILRTNLSLPFQLDQGFLWGIPWPGKLSWWLQHLALPTRADLCLAHPQSQDRSPQIHFALRHCPSEPTLQHNKHFTTAASGLHCLRCSWGCIFSFLFISFSASHFRLHWSYLVWHENSMIHSAAPCKIAQPHFYPCTDLFLFHYVASLKARHFSLP